MLNAFKINIKVNHRSSAHQHIERYYSHGFKLYVCTKQKQCNVMMTCGRHRCIHIDQ